MALLVSAAIGATISGIGSSIYWSTVITSKGGDPTPSDMVYHGNRGAQVSCRPRADVVAERQALLAADGSICGREEWGAGAVGGDHWRQISDTVVRYSQLPFKPQIGLNHILHITESLNRRKDSNFLMVGTGTDSPMWELLNRCGRTVFVEQSAEFADIVCGWLPNAEMVVYNKFITTYDGYKAQMDELRGLSGCTLQDMRSKRVTNAECKYVMDLDDDLYDIEWDVLLVDGPIGYANPARLQTAATAMALALYSNARTGKPVDWYLHDCERTTEAYFASQLWAESGYTVTTMKHGERRDRSMCHVRVT